MRILTPPQLKKMFTRIKATVIWSQHQSWPPPDPDSGRHDHNVLLIRVQPLVPDGGGQPGPVIPVSAAGPWGHLRSRCGETEEPSKMAVS